MAKFIGTRLEPDFWKEVKKSRGVLLIGCEGGYCILHTLPLYFGIKSLEIPVHLCNMTLASLKNSTAPVIHRDQGISKAPVCYEVSYKTEFTSGGTKPNEYFPEKYLCEWFRDKGEEDMIIYATEKTGPRNLSQAYQKICEIHAIDLIVIVDPGSDSLMAGDEYEIGAYLEDMLTMFSVHRTGVRGILCNIGIGYDRRIGVSDCSSLRAIAEITQTQGYLGSFSLTKSMKEVNQYINASEYVESKMAVRNISGHYIINSILGKFGNISISENQGRIFINPIMSQYYFFKLENVIRRIKYREFVEDIHNAADFLTGVEYYREELTSKIREEIPRTSQF
jgi:Protein of unknown function (DUF1152)